MATLSYPSPQSGGKQSIKHLVEQNAAISNIEVTDGNIKSFERTANKYGIDYALKKDTSEQPPRYLVFFKGDASKFGAVNTVVNKKRMGYNTDGFGFAALMAGEGLQLKRKTVLVLGAGGAGRCCIKTLMAAKADVHVYERELSRLKAVYSEFGGFAPYTAVPDCRFDIIVNCTGIGMHDTEGYAPVVPTRSGQNILPSLLSKCGAAVDLIYEPKQSEFLRIADGFHRQTANGAAMLFYQAYAADCIFFDKMPDVETANRLWRKYREVNA